MGKPTNSNRSNNKKNSKKNSKKSSYSGRRVVKKTNNKKVNNRRKRKTSRKNSKKTSRRSKRSFESASNTSDEFRSLLEEDLSEVSANKSFLPQNYENQNQNKISNFLAPGFNQPQTVTNHMNVDPLHVQTLGSCSW